jgi:hypothetical protein
MWIMAVNTGDQMLGNRVAVRQGKLTLHIEVALQAGFGRSTGIVDQMPAFPFH